ncbi:tachylectin-related carbohydrate-binding protein [Nonomuraea sp. bgisy101]|uniref:tachylectin-related carbohydrate-binding protein n=1 Tax=Nonomuraea sp. bgisy101 TaxID=3413784 RepID=UPI003D72B0B1
MRDLGALVASLVVGAGLVGVPLPASAATTPVTCSAVVPVYAVDSGGKLRWYGHRQGASGTDAWADGSGREIGHGWNTLTKVFSGGAGVIYAIDRDGDLKWYRHLAPSTGEEGWAPGKRTVIGTGWHDIVDAVSTGSGVIYTLDRSGDLRWYRHLSPTTGAEGWAAGSGKVIRSGWTAVTRLMTGRDGTLYGVNTKGYVRWYRHTDPRGGGTAFGEGTGLVVGEGWDGYRSMSAAGGGVMYGLDLTGRLWWERHADPLAGAPVWQARRTARTGLAGLTSVFADATACAANTSFSGYAAGRQGQTLAYRNGRVRAAFTVGARTALTFGDLRTLTEANSKASVATRARVSLLPAPWALGAPWAGEWLDRPRDAGEEDLLAIATQYLAQAPDRTKDGLRYAGDADYGPLLADGTRQEGSDFNDYLGVPWSYPGKTDAPEAKQKGALDCSGFVRMVFGYRGGLPLGVEGAMPAGALPRRAVEMAEDTAPGVTVIDGKGAKPASYADLQPGDLLFWDGSSDDGTAIDHVGVYLGIDSTGRHRFVSSRKSVNGPTLADVGGPSTLDGEMLYDRSWRKARRI